MEASITESEDAISSKEKQVMEQMDVLSEKELDAAIEETENQKTVDEESGLSLEKSFCKRKARAWTYKV